MLTPKKAEKLFLIGRPFSPIYGHFMEIRRLLYRKRILKPKRLPCPVISVGNLTLGGTGKSPHVIAICSFLRRLGHKPCVLTRGYGGKAGKGPLVVSDGKGIRASAQSSGDEPLMIASKLEGVPVIAGSDRYRCGTYAAQYFGPTVFVLDDGFQHIRLYRDIDLVLIEAPNPLGSERVFPGGILRETPRTLGLADAAILTKCNEVPLGMLELVEEQIRQLVKTKPIFRSFYQPGNIKIKYSGEIGSKSAKDLVSRNCFCFCGLARPDSFTRLLTDIGFKIKGSLQFSDHHFYSNKDLKKIGNMAKQKGAFIVLTTEKDFAKISSDKWGKINRELALAVVDINVKLPQSFWHFLSCRLEGAKSI